MNRRCPSCASNTIPVVRLALFGRPRCSQCRSAVGFHWLFGAAFACLEAVTLGLLVLYLLAAVGVVSGAVLALVALLALSLLAAAIAPLEVKVKWWAP
jgi:hypothetical protein